MAEMGGMSGDMMGSIIDASITQATNFQDQGFNSASAKTNRKWQEDMSNTAMQRQVKDLIAAGLNPVLAAGKLGGASTPSGAQASSKSQQIPSISDMLTRKMEAQTNRNRQEADKKKTEAEIDLMKKQGLGVSAKTILDMSQADYAVKGLEVLQSEIEKNHSASALNSAATAKQYQDVMTEEFNRELDKAKNRVYLNDGKPNKITPWIDYATSKLGDLFNVVVPIVPGAGKALKHYSPSGKRMGFGKD